MSSIKTTQKPHVIAQCLNMFPIGTLSSSRTITKEQLETSNQEKKFGIFFTFEDDKDENGEDFLRLSIVSRTSITVNGIMPPSEMRQFFFQAHHQGHFKVLGTKKELERIKEATYSIKDLWASISSQLWFAAYQARESIANMSGMDIAINSLLPTIKEVKRLVPSKD